MLQLTCYYLPPFAPSSASCNFLFNTESRTETLKIPQECSRAPMGTEECPWALISRHEHSWELLCMVPRRYKWYGRHAAILMNAHECCLCHGAMLMSAHGCLWVVMNASKHSWLWPYVAMSTNEVPQLLLSTHEHYKEPWALISLVSWPKQHSWVPISIHEHCAMTPIPLIVHLQHT